MCCDHMCFVRCGAPLPRDAKNPRPLVDFSPAHSRVPGARADSPAGALSAQWDRAVPVPRAGHTKAALLHDAQRGESQPGRFDLSSGDAGAVLQKLRNYDVRLAPVCAPGSVALTADSEKWSPKNDAETAGPFDTRAAGREWLGQP